MAEATTYTFTYKELAEALVKQQGLHKGIWGIYVRFGIGAVNIKEDDNSVEAIPSAIVPVKEIGLRKGEVVDSLSVDAAVVNPTLSRTQKRGKSR